MKKASGDSPNPKGDNLSSGAAFGNRKSNSGTGTDPPRSDTGYARPYAEYSATHPAGEGFFRFR